MQLSKIIKELCQPAYVYFILSSIGLIFYIYIITAYSSKIDISNYTKGGLITNIIITIFWIFLLNEICKIPKTGKKLAWFFVLLPFIIVAFVIIGTTCTYTIINTEEEIKQNNSRNQVQS